MYLLLTISLLLILEFFSLLADKPFLWLYFVYASDGDPIQSSVNKRAQVFLFARIFYNITFTYKLKHLRFQLTRNKNCKENLDQASVCLDDFWKY